MPKSISSLAITNDDKRKEYEAEYRVLHSEAITMYNLDKTADVFIMLIKPNFPKLTFEQYLQKHNIKHFY